MSEKVAKGLPLRLKLGECEDVCVLPKGFNKLIKEAEGIVIMLFKGEKTWSTYAHGTVNLEVMLKEVSGMIEEASGMRVVGLAVAPEDKSGEYVA